MFHRRFALLAGAFALFATVPGVGQNQAPATPKVPLIEPATLQSYMKAGVKYHLVDVRTQAEYDQGHIEGAVLMPLDTLPNTYASLPKKGNLIIYCRSGHRSAKAVQFLMEHGYTNAVSLNGGYLAWTAAQH